MKQWIREWLGLTEIVHQLEHTRAENEAWYRTLAAKLKSIEVMYGTSANGLARVIAKVDPMYGKSEFDPDRIAASKELEDQILTKLRAEYQVTHRGQ